jgi:hypothetical protein
MLMKKHTRIRYYLLAVAMLISTGGFSQTVPAGINYQAVARDNLGKEICNREIDVRFSILQGSPLGTLVYEELHSKISTKQYGVFSLVIGQGDKTGGSALTFADIPWETANYWLKVEIKFDNNFLDMGTMQFMAVPYALFAKKSLEPGPQGPKGEPGDPASDDQNLSFDGKSLSIEGGNTVDLSGLDIPLSLSLFGDTLSILGGNKIGLPNYQQDLQLDDNNILKITKNNTATPVNLSKYLQQLNFNTSDNKLSISGVAGSVDLSQLANDADANPTNELQTLIYDKNSGDLTISSKNTVSLFNSVGFKARKTVAQTGLATFTTFPFICPEAEFNDGSCYDAGTGIFTASAKGIYVFNVYYKADGSGSARALTMLKNGNVYEILGPDISSGAELNKTVTIKLDQGDSISLTIYTGTATVSGTGSFVGYKVN